MILIKLKQEISIGLSSHDFPATVSSSIPFDAWQKSAQVCKVTFSRFYADKACLPAQKIMLSLEKVDLSELLDPPRSMDSIVRISRRWQLN